MHVYTKASIALKSFFNRVMCAQQCIVVNASTFRLNDA